MGKLFYIIGASGAGKDSLINYCRSQINGSFPIIFAHRYITRPANAGGENHVSLNKGEFELRLKNGLFAMHWASHNLHYGIGAEINLWLQKGFNVVINGSREYMPVAMAKYPQMQAILIDADAEIIKTRLLNRGREDEKSIIERIARNKQLDGFDQHLIQILNNGLLEHAGNILLNYLLQTEAVTRDIPTV